jgi:LPXTG-motif cell wall-anchored protein
MLKKIASLAALAGIVLFGLAAPASAAPALSGTLPAATSENQTVPLSFTLSGTGWTDVLVTISVVEGTLTVDPSGGVVAADGYDLTDVTADTQAFRGSVADIAATLDGGIDWITPATVGTYSIDFEIQAQEYFAGLSFNPANGHYYLVPEDEFGPLELSGEDLFASAAAGDYTYAGLTGYVAEINDAQENTFIAEYSGGTNIWIGGSAEHTIIEAYTTTTGAAIGDWVWINSGTHFALGLNPANAVGGAFTSFASGEPNGGNSFEGCLVTNWSGGVGMWNDLTCDDSRTERFIIEFAPTTELGNVVLTLTDEDLADLASTGVESSGIALTAGALVLAGLATVAYRRRRV